jgi:S1-C subfamily serine protease
LKDVKGVLVNQVTSNSAADRAGVKAGDVILKLNGTDISDVNALRNTVASTAPGTDINLTVIRNGSQQEIHAKVAEFKAKNNGPNDNQSSNDNQAPAGKLGIEAEPLTPDLASQAEVPKNTQGLLVTNVDPSGPAANAGIEPGDVIEQINRQPVHSAGDVGSALAKSGDRPALALVNRKGQNVFVPIRMK